MSCPACFSRDIDFHESNGHSYCVSCGTVVEENAIVSSIEFQESGDRSHVIGQFVSQNCAQPFSASSRTRGRFGNSNSREQTLANIRRIISQVAGSLHLPSLYIDRAYRLYQLALQKNFVFGRRQMHVVATCLYVICRQEKSPHLLIDFSDALQVNVFVLGKSYLQFIRLLSLKLPIVDPSLYIHRFAQRLELGPKINGVATTALRIVTRMKKDWIILGRRPDGICASAMLIACRAYGFNKSQGELAKIFRISADTLRKRLDEFMATPSAQLTVEQFHFQDCGIEFDPPSFIRNKLKECAAEEAAEPVEAANENFYDDENLYPSHCRKKPRICFNFDDSSSAPAASADEDDVMGFVDELGETCIGTRLLIGDVEVMVPLPGPRSTSERRTQKGVSECSMYSELQSGLEESSSTCTVSEGTSKIADANSKASFGADDVDDEIESYILNPEEQAKRAAIWEKCFRAFVNERESRRAAKKAELAARHGLFPEQEGDMDAVEYNASTHGLYLTKTGKWRKKTVRRDGPVENVSQAVLGSSNGSSLLSSSAQPKSKKINYEVLKKAFGSDGNFAVPENIPNVSQLNGGHPSVGRVPSTQTRKPSLQVTAKSVEEDIEDEIEEDEEDFGSSYPQTLAHPDMDNEYEDEYY